MARKLKVAVIVNGHAGVGTSREGLGLAAAQRLTARDLIFVTDSFDDLRTAILRCIKLKVDVLGIAGGDGTLQVTLSMFYKLWAEHAPKRTPPKILILPLGTMRLVATNLKLTSTKLLDLAEYFGQKFSRGEATEDYVLYMLKVNDVLAFIYGTGVVTEILKEYNKKKQRGPLGAFDVLQQSFFEEFFAALTFTKPKLQLTRPVKATVLLPGHHIDVCPHREHTTLVCSAVREVGLGCVGMPDAMSKPNHFMLRSSRMSYAGYIVNLPAIYLGLRPPKTFDAVVNSAIIRYAEPTITTVDGEMREAVTEDIIGSGPAVTCIVG